MERGGACVARREQMQTSGPNITTRDQEPAAYRSHRPGRWTGAQGSGEAPLHSTVLLGLLIGAGTLVVWA
jgi:hypothetical protein